MSRYRAILFDLDGTLLDTLADIGNAMNRVLAAHGFPLRDLDAYRYFVGDGARMLVARALPEDRRNEDTIRRCLDEYREDYGKHWSVETRPYPGVPELLDALRRRGLKLAVLSNKPDAFTKKCVAALLPRDAFDAVAGERPDVPRKPDPAGARAMATQFGAAPGDCLYVGDSGIDMKTAVGAGMFPVGVLWGFRPREEMEASGARVLVAAPTEILNLLDR